MTDLYNKEPKVTHNVDEDLSQILKEIRSIPRLTPEEEQNLARRCAQGDEEAIRAMVTANLRLVVSIAKRHAGQGVPLLDLFQEGSIGLISAAQNFDYTLGNRFSTYATDWIIRGVTRCILNSGSAIRVPVHTHEKMRKIRAVRIRLRHELKRMPTSREISQASGIEEDKVEELTRLMPEICSLDLKIAEEEEKNGGLMSVVENDTTPKPYESMVRQELDRTIAELLSMLNAREQKVLRLHFGMEDGRCWSLAEIGKLLGVSKERTRQIECDAMEKLKKNGKSLGLEDFLDE